MNFFNEIIDEVSKVGNEISDTQVCAMTTAIQSANHIFFAGAGVSLRCLNLSTSLPDLTPQKSHSNANFSFTRFITNSPVLFIIS